MDDPKKTLERALSRMEAALSGRPPQRQEGPGSAATALGVFAIALMVAGATKGLWWVFAMGVILAGAGGILFLSSARWKAGKTPRTFRRADIATRGDVDVAAAASTTSTRSSRGSTVPELPSCRL
jgi:hypothetical protein